MTFQPRRGLLTLGLALPVFGVLSAIKEMLESNPSLASGAFWAIGMSLAFGLIATFSQVLDR